MSLASRTVRRASGWSREGRRDGPRQVLSRSRSVARRGILERSSGTCRAVSSDYQSSSSKGFEGHLGLSGDEDPVRVVLGPGESLRHVARWELPGPAGEWVTATVTAPAGGEGKRVICVTSNHPGNLVLHWGVMKRNAEKQGWYLPNKRRESELPVGTKAYKKRALQSPFTRKRTTSFGCEGEQQVVIELAEGEAYTCFNFVLKDTIENEWYNCREEGSNFTIPLGQGAEDRSSSPAAKAKSSTAAATPARRQAPIPELPADLCGIWAYIKWEHSGCPERSAVEADREFQEGIEEMKAFLHEGYALDDLWKVANGEEKLKDFYRRTSSAGGLSEPASTSRAAKEILDGLKPLELGQQQSPGVVVLPPEEIPEHLVGVQAYILWEEAGKPDGADFGDQARREIQALVSRTGMTLDQVEEHLKKPKGAQERVEAERPKPGVVAPAPVPEDPLPEPKTEVAQQRHQQEREERAPPTVPVPEPAKQGNALQWIKPEKKEGSSATPDLVQEAIKSEYSKESPLQELIQAATIDSSSEGNVSWKRVYQMGNSCNLLAVVRDETDTDEWTLTLTTDLPNEVELHWGILKSSSRRSAWTLPETSLWPSKTAECEDGISVDTAFGQYRSPPRVPLQQVSVRVPKSLDDIFGIAFVVKSSDATQWWKDGGHSNFVVPFPNQNQHGQGDDLQDALVDEIVDRENRDQWTLMHRFNACSELIRGVMDGHFGDDRTRGFSTLFIWLRYSSMRQLTWQRNYNTQPRILAGAQENLTLELTRAFKNTADFGSAQQWARMCMSCVGKGGSNGQKIRDDILHIMHRHKVKEVKGTWMEEWHQKLHNNTTPDDIPICEAYISFLESGGNRDVYWSVLSEAGLTRERLESFDRPIRCEPEDFPDKRDGLIHDFRDYLRTLKSVHSGTDLQTAASECQQVINDHNELKSKMGYVLSQAGRNSSDPHAARDFIQCAVDARAILHGIGAFYNTQDDGRRARDCLYLDAALESQIRASAESAAGSLRTDSSGWVSAGQLVEPLLQNLCLSTGDNSELCYCLQAWQNLPDHYKTNASLGKEEALLVSSVVDRMKRAVGDLSDMTTSNLQPIAHAIGSRTDCDRWTVELFTEEVVRGGPAFSVSLVLSMLEPSLRSLAELGSWQIISPAADPVLKGAKVFRSEQLYTCMNLSFPFPCVLVCDRVTGEEEIPENCLAVLTRDSPDMLSHIAVRARNEKVLLATCHDESEFESIKVKEAVPIEDLEAMGGDAGEGKWFALETTASGSVTYKRVDPPKEGEGKGQHAATSKRNLKISSPKWVGKYAVGMDEFVSDVVGAKSKNLAGLRDKIPDWINLPSSLTIPFGTFEHVLDDCGENAEISKEIAKLTRKNVVDRDPERCLEEAKQLAMGVYIPDEMWGALVEGMGSSGIEWTLNTSKDGTEEREQIAQAVKSVWASKFNLRAYYSLNKARLNFMDVRMAVLIQKVVNAEYAFVIHTTNPSTGDEGEIYCEVVKGLGEVLVGNYPGRALSFTCDKEALARGEDKSMLAVESFPSKSVGLYLPESLMFRSDSNGEDLEGYAGAGLYDSVPLHYPEPLRVDYSNDPIMTDPKFRKDLLTKVARVGLELEEVLGSPQDIEGCLDKEGNVYVVQTRPQM
ncbi:alpha-glucan water dikinase [Chloropicon primus]|uniref:Alpha-glucan water dikinase n=1 Tax=Chloropicon primus TaxID=1764295 RepID=A0A5B8MSA1_9CHLO|nr:alpha-glucan water dikinase [Chloropicon primus]|mmetsp:Transcript_3811/g.10981  ORF Transcript_3811/g.10981 Transcript_3811/m.10981 type:complete len:1628 (+) Transcript_3811:365-5248(+)|eukprot:QDZ23333.1 alpha-glucan water dikinase [Chloropicon primus]